MQPEHRQTRNIYHYKNNILSVMLAMGVNKLKRLTNNISGQGVEYWVERKIYNPSRSAFLQEARNSIFIY